MRAGARIIPRVLEWILESAVLQRQVWWRADRHDSLHMSFHQVVGVPAHSTRGQTFPP